MEDEIVSVERKHYQGSVYDLNVGQLHNYVAQGVVVHNCIFAWRGADPRILLDFPRAYPDAQLFPLDQNHRSTGVVVALSNVLAAPLRAGPESWTSNASGPLARVYAARDELDEARFVAAEIGRLLKSGEVSDPGQVAVLFRTNAQARAIALGLRAAGLPARLRADLDLFAHAAVRDLIAYLRLAHSPNDGPALARVINVPPRRLRAIEQALRKRPVPTAELPHWAQKRGGPTARQIAEEFVAMLQELHVNASERRPVEVLEMVLQRTGYREWLQGQKDGQTRLVHVEELRSVMRNTQAPDLATWLADMHLGEADTSTAESHAVVLTTIHASKGAEWPVVFLVGFEEGLLPHLRPAAADQLNRGAEDDRRLAYVAFSRTQVLLYLVYCLNRRIPSADEMGRLEPRRPSRFLVALPKDLIERVDQARVA